MRALLRLVALRYLNASPGRTILTLFGILLGVAVIFAIDVVNTSVMASFNATIDDIAGKTALTIGDEDVGVAEDLLEEVRGTEGVKAAVPVIIENARDARNGRQLAILGVDTLSDSEVRDYEVTKDDVQIEDEIAFLNDPHGVLVTREYATREKLAIGDVLPLETVRGKEDFTVRGLLSARGPAKVFGGDLLLMDVYAAQIAFGREGRFDRIDVVPLPGVETEALATRLETQLSGRAPVARPQRRSQEAERILAGFKMGLSIASLVAIFVGGFIVYNALAIAVAQRRREIGILRSLGATRTQVLLLFVGEGLVMGAAGSLLGLAGGVLLAHAVLDIVGNTISELYLRVQPEGLAVSPFQLFLGMTAGVTASFVAAFFPARRAAFLSPSEAMRKKVEAADLTLSSIRSSLIAGIATLLIAVATAWVARQQQNWYLGYGVAAVLAFAVAFLSPALAKLIGSLARPIASRMGPTIRLGADGFERNAGRNAVTIAALGMALANVVVVASFVGSMQTTVMNWFQRSIRSEVFVFAGREVKAKFEHPLPQSLGEAMDAMEGVAFVNAFRMVRSTFRNEPYYLISHNLAGYARYNEIPVVEGDLQTALAELAAGTGSAASQTFSQLYDVHLGDTLTLQAPGGPVTFRVAMVYVDYSADIGILCTEREVYRRLWRDDLVDSFGLYLDPGASAGAIRDRVLREHGKTYGLMALENAEYQRELVALIDRSFALTHAMELVAIIVAVLGIVNTLLVTVIDRRMEIGILKAIGAQAHQIRIMFMTEASLIGFASAVTGVITGIVFALYIVRELLRMQVGWTVDFDFPGQQIAITFVLAQLVALIASWWPARSAARLDVVDALEYE